MYTYQRDSVKSQIAQFWWLAPLSFGGSLLDIAPTVLTLFDLPVGRDMDGRPLVSIYEYPPAVRWIDSWDRVPGDAARVDAAPVAGGAATAAAVIRQLADLGYIDELPADQHDALEETAREERWNLARSLVDAGQLEEAAGLVTELWERWPDEVRFGMALFQYQLELGQILEARSTLLLLDERKTAAMARASEKLAQKFTELRATQGLPPAGEGQLDKGIDPQAVSVADHILIKRLKARSARNPDTFAFLEGKLLAAERRFPEALAAFERAKGVQASLRPTLILERAEVLLKMRKLSAATAEFQRVLEADPLNLAAQYGLARAAMAGQDAPRAAEAAKGAIGIRYHFPRAHLLAGVALWRAGELAEAERFLRSAVELQPVFPRRSADAWGLSGEDSRRPVCGDPSSQYGDRKPKPAPAGSRRRGPRGAASPRDSDGSRQWPAAGRAAAALDRPTGGVRRGGDGSAPFRHLHDDADALGGRDRHSQGRQAASRCEQSPWLPRI